MKSGSISKRMTNSIKSKNTIIVSKFSSKKKSQAKLRLSCVNARCIDSHLELNDLKQKLEKVSKEKDEISEKLNSTIHKLEKENQKLKDSKGSLLKDNANISDELTKMKNDYKNQCLRTKNQKELNFELNEDVKRLKAKAERRKTRIGKYKDSILRLKAKLAQPVVRHFEAKLQEDKSCQTDKEEKSSSIVEQKLISSTKYNFDNKIGAKIEKLFSPNLVGPQNTRSNNDGSINSRLKSEDIKSFLNEFEVSHLPLYRQSLINGFIRPDKVIDLYLNYAPINFQGESEEVLNNIKECLLMILK